MANIIQHKRSSTPGAVPLATGLSQGELGINIGDGKLYTKNSSNNVINLGITSISGTSITPASGNFSSSLKVNGVEVSVSGHNHDRVTSAGSLTTAVFNKTGSTIPKFSVVYINGGQGDQPTINLAIAGNEAGSSKTYGVTSEAISSMGTGIVVVAGALTGVNTDQFNPTAPVGDVNGSALWLSPSVSGSVTLTKPTAPNHMVYVGTIVRTHQNEGVVEVRVQNGFELEELHNVAISGVSNGQFLQYNSGSGLWIASSSGNFTSLNVNGTGVSVSGHTHTSSNITDFASSVSGLLPVKDIVAGNNIAITSSSGTYTINSTAAGGTGLQSSSYISQGKLSGNQSVTSGSDAVIQFVDDYDPQSWFDTTTRRFQPNIAGYYLISVGAWMDDADTTNGQANVQIRLNGNTVLIAQNQLNDTTGLSLGGSKVVYLNGTTNYIDFTFYHSTGSSRSLLSGGDGTFFTAVFLAWSAPPIGTQNYISKFGTSGSGIINSLIYDNGTNVGVGTSSPSANFDVVGSGHFSSSIVSDTDIQSPILATDLLMARDDFYPGIAGTINIGDYTTLNHLYWSISDTGLGNFADLQVNGTGVSVSGHSHTVSNITNFNSSVSGLFPANLVTGSGVANHIPYWSSTSGLLADSSQLYWDSTNNRLGIGTSTPSTTLSVSGITTLDGDLKFATITNRISWDNGTEYLGRFGDSIIVGTQGTNKILVNSVGNVGIGTDSPGSKLDVRGSAVFNEEGSDADFRIEGDTDSNLFFVDASTDRVGIGTSSPTYKLQVNGNFGATTKSFRINHPSKEGYSLEYGSLESPYHGVRLTGRGKIVDGVGIVQLPDYLKDLIHDDDSLTIQLTNYKHSKTLYVSDIDLDNDQVTVKADRCKTLGELEFFWSITGTRKDVENLVVEKRN